MLFDMSTHHSNGESNIRDLFTIRLSISMRAKCFIIIIRIDVGDIRWKIAFHHEIANRKCRLKVKVDSVITLDDRTLKLLFFLTFHSCFVNSFLFSNGKNVIVI